MGNDGDVDVACPRCHGTGWAPVLEPVGPFLREVSGVKRPCDCFAQKDVAVKAVLESDFGRALLNLLAMVDYPYKRMHYYSIRVRIVKAMIRAMLEESGASPERAKGRVDDENPSG